MGRKKVAFQAEAESPACRPLALSSPSQAMARRRPSCMDRHQKTAPVPLNRRGHAPRRRKALASSGGKPGRARAGCKGEPRVGGGATRKGSSGGRDEERAEGVDVGGAGGVGVVGLRGRAAPGRARRRRWWRRPPRARRGRGNGRDRRRPVGQPAEVRRARRDGAEDFVWCGGDAGGGQRVCRGGLVGGRGDSRSCGTGERPAAV